MAEDSTNTASLSSLPSEDHDPHWLQTAVQSLDLLIQGQISDPLPLDGADLSNPLFEKIEELRRHLLRIARERQAIAYVTEQIIAGDSIDAVLDSIYDHFRPLIPYDRIGFSVIEEDGETVRAHWVRSESPHQRLPMGYSAPLKDSTLKGLLDGGGVRILNDLETYLAEKPQSESTRLIVEEGMRSSLTCPVTAEEGPVGFLFFSSMKKDAYKDSHVFSYQRLARRVGLVLEKNRLYQEVVQASELKNRFLGVVAHDLRSPLSAVMGFMSLMENGYLGQMSDSQMDCLRRMDHNCRSMLHLIDGLLDISAIEAGKLELNCRSQDFHQFLREWSQSMRVLAQAKSIELLLETEDSPEVLFFDHQRIEQAMNNLASNAIKFSPKGSSVKVRTESRENELWVSVQDKGPGIPADEIHRIFGEFSRGSLKPSSGEKSTGLGLAIARRMIDAHHGRLWVHSDIGGGSIFTFSLPRSVPNSALTSH